MAIVAIGIGPAGARPATARPIPLTTEYTFQQEVRVPGATLAPGAYRFVAEPAGPMYLVRVTDVSGAVVARAAAAATTRSNAYGEVYRSFERATAGPPAIRTWFGPGNLHGFMFAWPEAEARALAQESGSTVLALAGDPQRAASVDAGSVFYVTPAGERTALLAAQLAPALRDDEDGLTWGQRANRHFDRATSMLEGILKTSGNAAQLHVSRTELEQILRSIRLGKDASMRIDRPRD
jgi:hypothetical protein